MRIRAHAAPLLLLAGLAGLAGLPALTGCEEGPRPRPAAPRSPDTVVPDAPLGPPRLPVCDPATPFDPGPSLVRRLSRVEYDHTVRDLLGVPRDLHLAREAFVPDEVFLGFDNNARALQVTPVHAEQYQAAAETLARDVGPHLEDHLICDASVHGPEGCASAFIEAFGLRAWRRPLTAAEHDRLRALYLLAPELMGDPLAEPEDPPLPFPIGDPEGDPHRAGLLRVVEALLQSPHFLYRVEVGAPVAERPDLRRLDGWEVASRLSYLLWRSMPDAALFDAAARGELSTPTQRAAQARRMLADPRARAGLWSFFEQWLQLDGTADLVRDGRYYPDFDDAQRALLAAEARAFVEHQVFAPEADLARLFDDHHGFRNAQLAEFYGESPVAGEALRRVPLDPARRRGVLTLGAVLARHAKPTMSSPIHRGIFVREQLLCTALPSPPDGVPTVAPDPSPDLTTREKFAAHTADEGCASCHRLIDGLGFTLEHYDALGRWRDHELGNAIDAAGTVVATRDLDGTYTGAAALAQALAGSEQVHRCVVTQVFRYTFGRGEQPVDDCTLTDLYAAYTGADPAVAARSPHDLLALLEGVVRAEAFAHRRAPEGTP